MEQSALIELVNTLTFEEKDQIRQFSKVPFFNPGKMKAFVPILLNICFDANKNITATLNKDTVFYKVFPDQIFIEGKLDKVMVEAHKLIRKVLLLNNYLKEEHEFQLSYDYSKILLERGLLTRFESSLTRLQKIQKEAKLKNVKFYNNQFLLEDLIHEYECFNNLVKGDLNIPNAINALTIFEKINFLALINRYLLQQKAVNITMPESVKFLIEDFKINPKHLEESPQLKANYAIFILLQKNVPESNDILFFYDLLQDLEHNLDKESVQEFYTYLRNICILVASTDYANKEIEITLNELYKNNLERGYLHYQGKLHPSRYWAVSNNALKVKDFDWALKFIETYKNNLIGENETQDIYRLNLANYYFMVGKFSNCLENISPVSPFVDYLLRGKCLEIKAYYELGSELLYYKLESFKVFLSRTSPKLLSESQKQNHVDFANLLTQISTSIPGDAKRANTLIQRIQNKKQAAEWRWLMEKAKALKEK